MTPVLTAAEATSFDGPHRLVEVSGPISLLRLCGRTAAGASNDPHGRYWFNARFFWNMLDLVSESAANTAQLNHYLRYVLREFTAVCRDWNSFASVFELRLPPRVSVQAAVGRIAPQPFRPAGNAVAKPMLSQDIFVGGEFQYIIDLKTNAALQRHVIGPRPLLAHHATRVQ